MYVLNEYMEFGVDTPHIATYNFKLVFHFEKPGEIPTEKR